MLAKKSTADANCTSQGNGTWFCNGTSGVDAGNSAKTLGLVSSIGWGAAIVGLSTSAVLFFTEPSRGNATKAGQLRVSVAAVGSGLRLEGSW